jgi:hypothetical protein
MIENMEEQGNDEMINSKKNEEGNFMKVDDWGQQN